MSAPALSDQTILLTGAANGLGRALARAFDAAGAALILVDAVADQLHETASLLRRAAEIRITDLSDTLATRELADDIQRTRGAVDTLIHNAGYLLPAPYSETDDALWDRTFNVGIPAAHILTKVFWRDWLTTGAAAIYLSSRSGIEGGADHAPYTATKHAIEGFVKCLGEEGKDAGVFVHAVTPGMYMHTPMSEQNYPPDLKSKWVEPTRLTAGLLYLAERPDPELSGRRLSAWELSEAHRDRYHDVLSSLGRAST